MGSPPITPRATSNWISASPTAAGSSRTNDTDARNGGASLLSARQRQAGSPPTTGSVPVRQVVGSPPPRRSRAYAADKITLPSYLGTPPSRRKDQSDIARTGRNALAALKTQSTENASVKEFAETYKGWKKDPAGSRKEVEEQSRQIEDRLLFQMARLEHACGEIRERESDLFFRFDDASREKGLPQIESDRQAVLDESCRLLIRLCNVLDALDG